MATPKTEEGRRRALANLTRGSRKGIPNRIQATVKQMMLMALDQAGGVEWLRARAQSRHMPERIAFLNLLGRCVPQELAAQFNHTGVTVRIVRNAPPIEPGELIPGECHVHSAEEVLGSQMLLERQE